MEDRIMARTLTRLAPGALLLLGATAAAQTIEVPLEYCERTESSRGFYAYGSTTTHFPQVGGWLSEDFSAAARSPQGLRLG